MKKNLLLFAWGLVTYLPAPQARWTRWDTQQTRSDV